MRDTKVRRDASLGQGTLYLAQDDLQHPALIEGCVICQEYGKFQPLIGTTQELQCTHWQQICSIGKECTF